ncbi:peptidylprolyl isomerase [Undibacterium sp. SXout7W]|uniref:peptidylprolyl isomerase n=1 Tax=Undibacterium sp. SXout7W TaxID=3413049 RepID=UPI003BF0715F
MNKIQMDLMGTKKSSSPIEKLTLSTQNLINETLDELKKETTVDQELRKNVIQVYEQREDILWDIREGNLPLTEELAAKIERSTGDLLVSTYIDQFFAEHKAEDVLLKNAYQEYLQTLKGNEYELSGITVKTLEDAKMVTAEFGRTRCFGEVASKYSINGNARSGGYIGWINENFLEPSTRELLRKMRPKQISEPIPTPEGFHLMYFENIRPTVPSSFEEVKQHLEMDILSKKFMAHTHKLHQQRTTQTTAT